MTMLYECDLDIVKMYLHTNNELLVKAFKGYSMTGRQTNRQTDVTECITMPQLQVVKIQTA